MYFCVITVKLENKRVRNLCYVLRVKNLDYVIELLYNGASTKLEVLVLMYMI